MYQPINAHEGVNAKTTALMPVEGTLGRSLAILSLMLLLLALLLLAGCKKNDIKEPESAVQSAAARAMNSEGEFRTYYSGLDKQTLWELQQARAATAKYRNIENAFKDGYVDIDVILPNMGYHYMQMSYVDGTFEIRKPEILVYNKMDDGSFELVAVEYAVPISLMPTTAPSGFTGTGDVWNYNTGFGLWLLHAWVWYNNPAGVFNATNPLVHVHP